MPEVPEGAKVPEDRLAKAEANDEPIDLSFEVDGETYTVSSELMDDLELLEMTADLNDGDATRMPLMARRLLGKDQWARFKESQRTEDGRVPFESAEKLFQKFYDAVGELSASS